MSKSRKIIRKNSDKVDKTLDKDEAVSSKSSTSSKVRGKTFGTKKSGHNSNSKSRVVSDTNSGINTSNVAVNDPSLYTTNPYLTSNAATIFFNNPTGVSSNYSTDSSGLIYVDTNLGIFNPNVMSIEIMPTFGFFGSHSDQFWLSSNNAMNVVAKKLRWKLTNKSGRNATYEANDILALYLRYYNLLIWLWQGRRMYAIAKKWFIQNPNLARNLISACAFNYDDIVANLADFRYQLNRLTDVFNKFCLPDLFNIRKRYQALFTTIYLDSNDPTTAQYYINTTGYHTWWCDDTTGKFVYRSSPAVNMSVQWSGGASYQSWVTTANNLLTGLVTSDDVEIIMQDVIRAFSSSSYYTYLKPTDDDEPVPVAFDFNYLNALHNADFFSIRDVEDNRISFINDSAFDRSVFPNFVGGIIQPSTYYTSVYEGTFGIFSAVVDSTGWFEAYQVTHKLMFADQATTYWNTTNVRKNKIVDIPMGIDPVSALMLEYTAFKADWDGPRTISDITINNLNGEKITFSLRGPVFVNYRDSIIVNVNLFGTDTANKMKIYNVKPFIPAAYTVDENAPVLASAQFMALSAYMSFDMRLPIALSQKYTVAGYLDTSSKVPVLMGSSANFGRLAHIDNWVTLSGKQVEKMHYVATNSLWDADNSALSVE